MYKLRLNAKQCISCGICADLCPLQALSMRSQETDGVEGSWRGGRVLADQWGDPVPAARKETFPLLRASALCDGCQLCVRECPVAALTVWDTDAIPAAV